MYQHLNQGCQKEKEEEQEVENLLEQIMKELPQSGKGNRLPGSPGSSESPKEVGPKRNTPKHIIITLPKIKEKERVTYKGVPIKLSADFSKGTWQARRTDVFKVMKGKDLHPR